MAEVAIRYEKIPGASRSLIAHVRLYLGPDHLLQVSTMYFQETYKRFYFADIQAIQIRQTDVHNVWNIVLVGGALFFLAIALAVGDVGGWILGGVAGAFLIGLLVNAAAGPTAETFIQTAVQTERLRSLDRLRRARKFLARTQPLIQAAQADRAAAFGSSTPGDAPGPSAAPESPPIIGPDRSPPTVDGAPPMGSEP